MVLKRVLIANRGEIACRIIRSCKSMGISSVAIYSEPDETACHVKLADMCGPVGPASARRSYLNTERILELCEEFDVDGVHPGYGFLAENASFAESVLDQDRIWIGPRPETIRAMGDKERAREMAMEAGVPVLPGSRRFSGADLTGLEEAAQKIGLPVLVKAAAGGGGIGMQRVDEMSALEQTVRSTQGLAKANFGDDTVFLEKFIPYARHIEVQILGLSDGRVLHLFERECSIQRRYQKVIEEAPSIALNERMRQKICADAVKLARSQKYTGAGTVEFVFDDVTGKYYFLEMNTRIQVEHPVTEMITGRDIVTDQMRIASNEEIKESQDELAWSGHAIECRIYAEDPFNKFLPQPGEIEHFEVPENDPNIRIDTGYRAGSRVHPYYDPLIAKVVIRGDDRDEAVERGLDALARTRIGGIKTNIPFLINVFKHGAYKKAQTRTSFIEDHKKDLLTNKA